MLYTSVSTQTPLLYNKWSVVLYVGGMSQGDRRIWDRYVIEISNDDEFRKLL